MNHNPGSLENGEAGCNSERSGSAPGAAVPTPTAIQDIASHLRLWLVAIIGLAFDLWTKHWAFTELEARPATVSPFVGIPHLVSFRRSLNPGALFGLGKGLTPIFILASVLALGFVLFLFWHSDRKRRSLHIALGLVLAGALGNLYDRAFMIADVVKFNNNGKTVTIVGKIVSAPDATPIRLGAWPGGEHPTPIPQSLAPQVRQQGVVRDFIKMEPHFNLGGYRIEMWPWVFNVADALLVWGVGLLMLNFWWERREEKRQAIAAHASREAERATDAATTA